MDSRVSESPSQMVLFPVMVPVPILVGPISKHTDLEETSSKTPVSWPLLHINPSVAFFSFHITSDPHIFDSSFFKALSLLLWSYLCIVIPLSWGEALIWEALICQGHVLCVPNTVIHLTSSHMWIASSKLRKPVEGYRPRPSSQDS